MTKEQFQTLLRFFKVMGDESRLKIVGILANQECSVEELAALLQLKEPTVSHHLSKLKQLNLVTMRPEGNTHLYQLDNQTLSTISRDVFVPEKIASLVVDIDKKAWESKVLRSYLVEEEKSVSNQNNKQQLKDIPASRKKRLVILKWLVNKFEVGVKYPESTVDEILKHYYPDSTIIKEELIANNLMQRERESMIYWRA
ncbi:metalloregulator ArsR/SmtB family transcription factor [Mastigocoleus sp. MO_188.B34]|uniref:DUF2087 domain-containing protein n=1 Tax=Mastigocoleus sp. MO_188.B34 TaxID=3036635 RepID=UPI00261CEE25|nr:metalloregulator ArsR/SmtB family transcription factor [Mastigocoleus sp. MO_188.B34]MDJ0692811.1 metalloregulator ArsR/SmtB family transcription factor [Mastigocoleus sp. MO_188.B34]